MKRSSFFGTFTCLLLATGACSTQGTKSDRSPASIREVANHLNKKVIRKKPPRIKFLENLNNPKRLKKNSGLVVKSNKTVKTLSSDTNNDGMADVVSFYSKGNIVGLKIDRNFDGKFDRSESLKGATRTVKYDDDFDGTIDKVLTSTAISANKLRQVVFYPKSKKRFSYILLTSSADSSKSEGKFCGDCEENFRRSVRDLRSEEAKEAQEDKWFEDVFDNDIDVYITTPGYKHTYLQLEPTIWYSDSCAGQGDSLAFLVSDAINDYFDCMNEWRNSGSDDNKKDLIKKRNANRLMQGLVSTVSNPKKPLKIHCALHDDVDGGWAISSKKSENLTNIPEKDAIGSIVLDLKDIDSSDDIENKNTILHEITHLFSGSHGDGCDNFNSCPALCLGKESLRGDKKIMAPKILSDSDWEKLKPSVERSCLADRDYKDDLSTDLDPRPYSYLNDIYKLYSADGGSSYNYLELSNQIVRELKKHGSQKSLPIQSLPKLQREELAFNFIMASGKWKKEQAQEYIKNFDPNRITNTDVPYGESDVIFASLLLDPTPITKERIDKLVNSVGKEFLIKDGNKYWFLRNIRRNL